MTELFALWRRAGEVVVGCPLQGGVKVGRGGARVVGGQVGIQGLVLNLDGLVGRDDLGHDFLEQGRVELSSGSVDVGRTGEALTGLEVPVAVGSAASVVSTLVTARQWFAGLVPDVTRLGVLARAGFAADEILVGGEECFGQMKLSAFGSPAGKGRWRSGQGRHGWNLYKGSKVESVEIYTKYTNSGGWHISKPPAEIARHFDVGDGFPRASLPIFVPYGASGANNLRALMA